MIHNSHNFIWIYLVSSSPFLHFTLSLSLSLRLPFSLLLSQLVSSRHQNEKKKNFEQSWCLLRSLSLMFCSLCDSIWVGFVSVFGSWHAIVIESNRPLSITYVMIPNEREQRPTEVFLKILNSTISDAFESSEPKIDDDINDDNGTKRVRGKNRQAKLQCDQS